MTDQDHSDISQPRTLVGDWLACVLRHARENDLMTHDPFQTLPSERLPAQEAQTETPALRASEINLLLAKAEGTRDRAAVTLLFDTGLRSSEACGLRWGDVSLSAGFISVEGQLAERRRGRPIQIVPTKSRAGVRRAPLTPRARERLEALYMRERERGLGGDEDFVLTTRSGGPLNRHNLRRTVRRLGEAAGLGHVVPKILRPSTATAYAEANVQPHIAARITGHSKAVYEKHYVKTRQDQLELEEAMRKLLASGYGSG